MQRRDMEEVERRALSGPGGDVRRGTLQRAVAGERSAEIAFPMERGPQTSDGKYSIVAGFFTLENFLVANCYSRKRFSQC